MSINDIRRSVGLPPYEVDDELPSELLETEPDPNLGRIADTLEDYLRLAVAGLEVAHGLDLPELDVKFAPLVDVVDDIKRRRGW